MNPSLSLSARRKSLRQTSSLSVATAITSIFLHSLSFLVICFISLIQWIFAITVGHFHFSLKLGDEVSLFCQFKAFFLSHGQWRCHCYYLVFSTFVTFFSLPPSCPQSPPSQDKIAFPRSAVHFFVLSLFFGPAQNPSLSCQQKHFSTPASIEMQVARI